MEGVVKWFNEKKGYGFITCDGSDRDVFVHHTEIQSSGFRTLHENERVEFDLEDGPKGLVARRVQVVT